MKSIFFLLILNAILTSAVASEPMFDRQWGLRNNGQSIYRPTGDIQVNKVVGTAGWDSSWPGLEVIQQLQTKDQEVIVAVIDSGLDMNHPEFAGRIYKGRDFLNPTQEMKDDKGHGTHVAGIIAANSNGIGIQGLTPKSVKILPLKVMSEAINGFIFKGRMITDIIADAIFYAVEAKASVINLSLGWPQIANTPRVIRALELAAERGVVVVGASGNNNKDVPIWPCAHPSVICVGAIDNQGRLVESSNHGGKVDLVAPGEQIVSTYPLAMESRSLRIQGYEAISGSSQAAPFVAAAAALLKLNDASLSVKQIKGKLFSSARQLAQGPDDRFVRFGALSITDALTQKEIPFATVSVKKLISVGVNSSGEYEFSLPIELFGVNEASPVISISGIEAEVSVMPSEVKFRGKIKNFLQDSEVLVRISTKLGGVENVTPLTLSFSRVIDADGMKRVKIPEISHAKLLTIQGDRKLSRITQVIVDGTASSEFHGFIQSRSGDTIRVTTIRAKSNEANGTTKNFELKNFSELYSVFEKDVNLDGENDLVFYGMNTGKDHLILHFFSSQGSELFAKHSIWEMPLTTFEGLPIKEGDKSEVSWLRVNTFLGEIAVPYYQRLWFLPDEDNSADILEHVTTGRENHFYFWEPNLQDGRVVTRPRVLDSVEFLSKVRRELGVSSFAKINFERIVPQTNDEKATGQVRHVISVGESFYRKFFVLTANSKNHYKLSATLDGDYFQVENNLLVTRQLDDFKVSKNSVQLALLDRATARIKPYVAGELHVPWVLKTSGWSNPIFEVVASFEKNNTRTLFLESRHHVYAYSRDGDELIQARRLPINRDSSFPGVSFSETLQGALVGSDGENLPGLSVNSSLIYGDRLYTMVSADDQFVRPIALSIKIPPGCVPLKTQFLGLSDIISAYAMVCQTQEGAEFRFFPLKLNP